LRVHLYDHSGGVVSPCTNIDDEPDKYLQIFSCIVFGNLSCIGFDPTIHILKHTLRPSSRPIDLTSHKAKIRVNENMYDILEIIFSNQGLVGRGTVCYLARKDGEEYIIKDHWVLGGKTQVLNEISMLKKMEGVRGVPHLVEYWLVESEPDEVDETRRYRFKTPRSIKGTSRTHVRLVLKPRARPLHQFRSHAELLTAIRDIVKSK
ncbi:hypothetical protein DEU56DRAFT_745387, partial [Suillus clintonianus]|uniref:uncharacterized protein n=1 Tax=Suillus clintonianus TaxID=1904413 RepID=UPI001B8815ED